jgi:hypothetical protein
MKYYEHPMNLEEFKEAFYEEIQECDLSEEQIRGNYEMYLEDPMQYSGGMITNDLEELDYWIVKAQQSRRYGGI